MAEHHLRCNKQKYRKQKQRKGKTMVSQQAQFRTSYGRFPADPWMTELINDLQAISPEFRAWWPDHEVLRGPDVRKVLNHPQVGYMHFTRVMFQVYDEPDLKAIVSTPLNEGETIAKMRQLLVSRSVSSKLS